MFSIVDVLIIVDVLVRTFYGKKNSIIKKLKKKAKGRILHRLTPDKKKKRKIDDMEILNKVLQKRERNMKIVLS